MILNLIPSEDFYFGNCHFYMPLVECNILFIINRNDDTSLTLQNYRAPEDIIQDDEENPTPMSSPGGGAYDNLQQQLERTASLCQNLLSTQSGGMMQQPNAAGTPGKIAVSNYGLRTSTSFWCLWKQK